MINYLFNTFEMVLEKYVFPVADQMPEPWGFLFVYAFGGSVGTAIVCVLALIVKKHL